MERTHGGLNHHTDDKQMPFFESNVLNGPSPLGRRALLRYATLVAFALAMLATGTARASSISYTGWYSMQNGPVPSSPQRTYTPTDFNGVTQIIALPQFDTSLGILTAATLDFYADLNSFGNLKNTSAGMAKITSYKAMMDVRLLSPGSTTPGMVNSPYLLDAAPLLISLSKTTLAAGNAISFNVAGSSATVSLDLLSSSILQSFEGQGTVRLPLYTTTTSILNGSGGNLMLTQTTEARAAATVSYAYTAVLPVAVPEPGSIAQLTSSLLCLAGLIRRYPRKRGHVTESG